MQKDVLDLFVDRPSHWDHDRGFLWSGPLKRNDLAIKQIRRHEMVSARFKTRADRLAVAIQVHECDARARALQRLAVGMAQSRTGDHAAFTRRESGVDPAFHRSQPWRPVTIVKRKASLHLGDVGERVKRVAILETRVKRMRQRLANAGFSSAGNAHDHHHKRHMTG